MTDRYDFDSHLTTSPDLLQSQCRNFKSDSHNRSMEELSDVNFRSRSSSFVHEKSRNCFNLPLSRLSLNFHQVVSFLVAYTRLYKSVGRSAPFVFFSRSLFSTPKRRPRPRARTSAIFREGTLNCKTASSLSWRKLPRRKPNEKKSRRNSNLPTNGSSSRSPT